MNQWEYDCRGRLKALLESDGAKITRHDYNLRGDKIAETKPDGTNLFYEYNSLRHLTRLYSSDGTVDHQLQVNLLGELLSFDQISRKLDPHGHVCSEAFPFGITLNSSYDHQGRKTDICIEEQDLRIAYTYGPIDLKFVHFKDFCHHYLDYDLSGNLLAEELIGFLGKIERTYDIASHPKSLKAPHFVQTVDLYDPVGKIVQMRIDGIEQKYAYDDLYQLVSESAPFQNTYFHDSLGARLTKNKETYLINSLHQVTSHAIYDLNGNPVQIGDIYLTYDALDRLIEVKTREKRETFTYDYLNRCLTRTVSGERPLYFIYDGQNEIGSFDGTLKEFRVLGKTESAEIGAAIALLLNDQIYVPIHDLQGNLARVISLENELVETLQYSAFGEETSNNPFFSPWRFSSKRKDPITGFINYGRRYYVPPLGRWLTADPLGFAGGMNLYLFLQNDPLIHLDDYGLIDYGQYDRSWRDSQQQNQQMVSAALHTVGSQAFGLGNLVAASPYYIEKGFNYLSGRQSCLFSGWNEKQSQFFNKAEDWMYRALATDRNHPDYLMYRGGFELATVLAGGYGVGKALYKGAQWGINGFRMSRGALGSPIKWSPINGPGPLKVREALSFRSATYTEHRLQDSQIFYRVYSDPSKAVGSYWTRVPPSGSLNSIMDLALKPEWGNKATSIIKVKVPKGTTVFEGIVGPQDGLLGGGNQIILPEVNKSWIIP